MTPPALFLQFQEHFPMQEGDRQIHTLDIACFKMYANIISQRAKVDTSFAMIYIKQVAKLHEHHLPVDQSKQGEL